MKKGIVIIISVFMVGALILTSIMAVVNYQRAEANYQEAELAFVRYEELLDDYNENERAFASTIYSLPLDYDDASFVCTEEYKNGFNPIIEISKPDDYVPIEIVKWTGDDYYITMGSIGNYREYVPIIGKDGIVYQWKQTNFWGTSGARGIFDVNVMDDSILCLAQPFGAYEFDFKGNIIWKLPMPGLSHQATLTPEGTYMVVRTNFDQVLEVNRDGSVVWEWNASEHIVDYSADNYVNYSEPKQQFFGNIYARSREKPGENPPIWTHVNGVQKLDDGYLISLRNQDLVLRTDFEGNTVSTFGALILKHQHHPVLLPDGNMMVYDNGNGRVVEFNPDGSVAWEYKGLSAPGLGWIEKLWNGNYLFPDCFAGRILEVTPEGEIMKEILIPGGPIYQAKGFRELPDGLK